MVEPAAVANGSLVSVSVSTAAGAHRRQSLHTGRPSGSPTIPTTSASRPAPQCADRRATGTAPNGQILL